MKRFQLTPLPLQGLVLAQRQPLSDSRGFLERMFCTEVFRDVGVIFKPGSLSVNLRNVALNGIRHGCAVRIWFKCLTDSSNSHFDPHPVQDAQS